jgi:hypothetical protein
MKIVPIVEGHGEVEAVPVLIRRFAKETGRLPIEVGVPIRVKRDKLLKPGELERAVDLAAAKAGPGGRILVLLDAEDDCPAELAPRLAQRARQARADRMIGVVLARREFEAWFLAAAESLRALRTLRDDLIAPRDPEGIQGAKEWLSARMHAPGGYHETVDQPALAARFDLHQARAAPSFDKCYRELTRLLAD